MEKVTMHGNNVTLLGADLKVGQKAPDFTLIDKGLNQVSLKDFLGKVVILSIVPSLDTPTCDMETRRFNNEAAKLGDNIVILTVSKDLPFAQARWCAAAGIDKVKTLSDYRNSSFSTDYGVLIKELYLLTRAVFVIDRKGEITYKQFVSEISKEPDYNPILAEAKKLI